MNNYKRLNNLIGWLVFFVAATVYLLTSEPTASFWDCGEYIATSFKLQVGHPPGAPTFQLIGRFFTLFAFGDVQLVAMMINSLSALSSAFTILFLFWSITHLSKKMFFKNGEMDLPSMVAVLGAGVVGALAYTFSDSFWFSAVEGEVYASSSFFTAIVFWAMLKWEDQADDPKSMRWVLLIAFLVGISIGVHLLNLLTLPAIILIYYYRKYKPNWKGTAIALLLSLVLLGLILWVAIPGIVYLAGMFELFFVNSMGMPFNSGTIIYFVLLIGLIILGLRWTKRKGKVAFNTAILAFTFMLIGYSTFIVLIIRSNSETPINENNPSNAISLLAYLNREQYGDTPLFYGQYFNAPMNSGDQWKDQMPVYEKDVAKGKYVITDDRKNSKPTYNKEFMTIFPRMWSNQEQSHINVYKEWGNVKGNPVRVQENGETKTLYKPTFGENLRFFFTYQIGHMYLRYFLWNFVGRQNDIQGHGGPLEGNWYSGIPFLDQNRLGDLSAEPTHFSNNAGRNAYYFLPFLLGLIGLLFQLNKSYRDMLVVSLLFFMTGFAIVIYLNQTPYQPRERDYAYAASFYAFAMWIGMGVLAIFSLLRRYIKGITAAIIPTLLCLVLVPGIMAKENWNDHDRSDRYTARDFARNYLNSCAPNAILFTNGDNDTFPLWYVQEVEGYRTDVRVVNLSLLNTDWYADQMKRRAYESAPVPISMTHDQYRQGQRDVVYLLEQENVKGFVNVKELFDLIRKSPERLQFNSPQVGLVNFFPTKQFYVPVDSSKVVNNGTVPKRWANEVVDSMNWKLDRFAIQKNSLFLMDILASFNWDRPIYFAITTGDEAYIGLQDYFVLEGLAYRLVPIKATSHDGQTGRVDTEIMYDNMMNKFVWGNMNGPGVYLDETNRRMCMNFRNNFARLATALIIENKKDSALKVLDRAMELMPENVAPFNYFVLPLAEAYYAAGATEKGNAIVNRLIDIYESELVFYFNFKGNKANLVDADKQQALAIMDRIAKVCEKAEQKTQAARAKSIFDTYYSRYIGGNPLLNK